MAIPSRFSFSFIDDNPPDKGCDNLERQLFNIGVLMHQIQEACVPLFFLRFCFSNCITDKILQVLDFFLKGLLFCFVCLKHGLEASVGKDACNILLKQSIDNGIYLVSSLLACNKLCFCFPCHLSLTGFQLCAYQLTKFILRIAGQSRDFLKVGQNASFQNVLRNTMR